jgi:phospholipase/lecithinase/hemolysin
MSLKRRVFAVVFAFLYLFPGVFAHCQAYTSIVIFGDSLSDTGNDATLSKAKYGASAQVPGPATDYTNGSFTDGTDTVPAARNYTGVWAVQLAAMLSAHPAVVNSLAGGTDYAYGFGTTDVGTTVFTYGPGNALSFTVNNMGQQVTDYLATNPTITNKTLFIVWGGANDLINATSSADIVNAATRDAAIVQRLINAGATDILVPNLPPLGLVPRFNGSPTTSTPATQAAAGFDQALAAGLAAIPPANPGKTLHIFQLDTYTLFNTIIGPPINSHFVNVTASSQGNAAINPDTYLFWDDLHPTTAGHSLIADAAFTLLGTPVVTTTTVVSNNLDANLNASVTFTASVTDSTGTPTGTVTFLDGTTTLGSALVTGSTTTATATASFTTTGLTAGTHNITAQFGGVNGYAGSTSTSISEVVTAPALTSSFVPSSLTIVSGTSGTSSLTLTPVGGYSGTATLACGTLPKNFTCSISTTTLVLPGDNNPQNVAFTVGAFIPKTTALLHQGNGSSKLPEVLTAFALFPGLGFLGLAAVGRRRRDLRKLGLVVLLSMTLGGSTLGLSGCGNGGRPSNYVNSGSYVIPATVTINGTTTTINLNVTVP